MKHIKNFRPLALAAILVVTSAAAAVCGLVMKGQLQKYVGSSISPDRCYLLLHGNMLACSALFQVEKRCAANSCRRKPEQ